MLTFEQVTNIEYVRRKIEALQNLLSEQSDIKEFGYRRAFSATWASVDADLHPMVREALCKTTIVKMLRLLDEASQLGVDTTAARDKLAEFLETLAKPPEAVS